MKGARWIFLLMTAMILGIVTLPSMAAEETEPLLVQEMVREMTRQGVPEEGALRLAHQNRFMAEMAAGTLEQEQQRLQDCDCEPLGGQEPDRTRDRLREQDRDCLLDGTGDKLRTRAEARVGAAFGRALGSAYRNYGEEGCSQAALALFSATRRGLSPETGAITVEAFAENGYRLEEMYRFSMWMAERVSTGTQMDEEVLCEQVRQMTRQRLQLTDMTGQMERTCEEASEGRASQGGSRSGQSESKGQGGSESSGSGGNSGGDSSGGNGGGGNSGGGNGGKSHGR